MPLIPRTEDDETPKRWLTTVVGLFGGAAVVALALEYGFEDPPAPLPVLLGVQALAVAAYVFARVWQIATAPRKWAALMRRPIDLVILLLAGAYGLIEVEFTTTPVLTASAFYIGLMQLVLAVRFGVEAIRLNVTLSQGSVHPGRAVLTGFGLLIVAGTLLLALPRSSNPNVYAHPGMTPSMHLLNCLFTATSATCVTGLTVYDTGVDFTRFGHVVILLLIQFGGLGIMIFGSTLGLLVGRELSLRQSLVVQDASQSRTLSEIRRLVAFIVITTLLIEAVGAALLYPMWSPTIAAPAERLFYSVFHSVSAFCNAGFALPADSLVGYRRSWQVYGVFGPLIILGGLGFPVLINVWDTTRARATAWLAGNRRGRKRPAREVRLTLHSRLVLRMTLALLVLGAVMLYVSSTMHARLLNTAAPPSERPRVGALCLSSPGERWLGCVFQSITCRTAGFNSVPQDITSMSAGQHFISSLLMFIGGSPASTAGGAKTASVAVIMLAVWCTVRGRRDVEALHRAIPEIVVRKAGVIVVMLLTSISATTFVLSLFEPATLREILFESVSAWGTVGLSTGITPTLSAPSKLAITASMFGGRVGPLTVMVALAGYVTQADYEYPKESVTLG